MHAGRQSWLRLYERHGHHARGASPIPPTTGSSASTHITMVIFDRKLSSIVEAV